MKWTLNNTFPVSEQSQTSSKYYSFVNELNQICGQVIESSDPRVLITVYWGYRMLKPGVGGKAQANHLAKLGKFDTLEAAQQAVENYKEPTP